MDEGSVDVGDERALGYREFGDPNGQPVVNCHGGLVCGLDVAPFHDAALELGARLELPAAKDTSSVTGTRPTCCATSSNSKR